MSLTPLPSDNEFLALLEEKHGVQLTHRDLESINEFHFYLRNVRETQLANDPNAVFYDVQDGKIIGILAFAAIGFFAAPLLGVGGIVGALMGAAIGWRLFGGKEEEKKQEEAKTATSYGFDGLSSLPSIGGAIPLIYCDRINNPNGGILANGFCTHSRVETSKNSQKIYQLFVFGLGQIGQIDVSKTLINDQPLDNFFAGDIVVTPQLGTLTQLPLPQFDIYSQSISPNANNQIGVDVKSAVASVTGNSITIKTDDKNKDTVDIFTPSDIYRSQGVDFRVIGKSGETTILTNIVVPTVANAWISAIYNSKYTTSKKINQLDINFNAVYWARKNDEDDGSVLTKQAGVFDLYVKPEPSGTEIKLCRFAIESKSTSNLRRVLKIRNMPYGKYTVSIKSVDFAQLQIEGNNNAYLLDDSGNFVDYVFSGYVVTMEGGVFASVFDGLNPGDKTQWGNQGNAPATITSYNEIVYSTSLGQSRVVSYPGLPYAAFIANASNQLQGNPNVKFLLTLGRNQMRVHIWSGTATATNANTLIDTVRGIGSTQVGNIIRNLDKRTQSVISSIDSVNGLIATFDEIAWDKGDRWISFIINASSFFPDIYVDTLSNPDGGLGNFIDADYFIDYDSICDSLAFCRANGFFWDGTISAPIPWAQWATKESMGSLLFPSRINGKFALLPEIQRNPVALFNASNVWDFTEEFAEKQELNTVVVSYKDGSDAKFKTASVTIMTDDAYNGIVSITEESVNLDSVTNQAQAIKVGQVYLKTRLLQDRAISFKTGLQGSYLQPGDLIICQHVITQFNRECSGFALESTFDIDHYIVKLSADVELGIDPSKYSCAVFHLESGQVQNNLTVYSVDTGASGVKLYIYGSNQPILAPSENRTGDYITIGENLTENRIYKISVVDPQPDGSVGITAVLWLEQMLNSDGLVTVT